MNTNLKLSRRIASVLLLGIALASSASAQAVAAADLTQKMAAARTRSDYEALATYYDQQAAGACAIATEHRKMAKQAQP